MRKKYISILICLLLVGNCVLSCVICSPVFALSAGGLQSTIASVIISLMLQCGVAPVNNAWLTQLNNAYGVESSIGTIQDCITSGLLTESGGTLIDSGLTNAIQSSSEYTELGLAEIFTTSADDVASGVVAASGAKNIATTAINVGTTGTIGAFAGAATVGVGLGVLINHARESLINFIRSGAKITYNKDVINNCPSDKRCFYTSYGGSGSTKYRTVYYYIQNDIKTCAYPSTDNDGNIVKFIGFGNTKTSGLLYNVNVLLGDTVEYTTTRFGPTGNGANLYEYGGDGNWGTPDTNFPYIAENVSEAQQYTKNVLDGVIEEPFIYSPDLIGNDGNHKATYKPDTGTYEDPSFQNVVPEGYDMNPVSMDDYMDYAEGANNNTDNENVNKPVQGEEFDNLIDSLLVEPSIIPDQGVTEPDVPDRPIIPDQPEVPGKDPITGEQQSEVLEGITTPDLRSVFPFCIPFDLYALLGNLKYETREAPVIVWEFNVLGNTYPVIIDLSPYDEAAEILRFCELFLFVIGLAVNTRKLIGAGG